MKRGWVGGQSFYRDGGRLIRTEWEAHDRSCGVVTRPGLVLPESVTNSYKNPLAVAEPAQPGNRCSQTRHDAPK